MDLVTQINTLVAKLPAAQQPAASALLSQYGPQFFELAANDAWAYLQRLLAGDFDVIAELNSKFSNAQWLAGVAANTAKWAGVAQYNEVRDQMAKEFLIRLAPIVGGLLAALVGL